MQRLRPVGSGIGTPLQYRRSPVDDLVRPRPWRRQQSRSRRTAIAGTLAAFVVVLMAPPAGAHTVGGVDVSNYRTRVRSITPAVAGITLRVVDNGDRLELTNSTGKDVVVVGYDDEPYVRVGPRGVFENEWSPATFLNRTRQNPAPPPESADPTATPQWRRISGGDTVRWHDHRAHWMGDRDPPFVEGAPGEEHLIQRFKIELRTDGETIQARGDVRWIPAPSPWLWIAGAAVFGVLIVVGARTRWAVPIVSSALIIVLVSAVVHAAGAWNASTSSTGQRFGDALPTLGAVVLGVIALVQLLRRGMRAAAPLLVFAGLFVGIAIGLADLSGLAKSQLPTTLPFALDRLTIALALGGGFGVAGGAAFHVGSTRRTPSSEPLPPTAGSDARAAFEARNAVGRESESITGN